MRQTIQLLLLAVLSAATLVHAQQSDAIINLTQGEPARIAVPDLRGAGTAAPLMGTINGTLFGELQQSGLFDMAPKSMYPLNVPQRPQDFNPQRADNQKGLWLADWSSPPVNANYLTIGYAAEQTGRLVLFGWLFGTGQPDLSSAQVFGKLYFGDLDENGARKVAREYAADILGQFGQTSLMGSKIYFVSDRSGTKEIWGMDYDGSNQKQITHYGSTSILPAVSPDGTKLLFTTYAEGQPMLYMHSLETGRRLPFYNQKASMSGTAEFTPDGQKILFSSTAAGGYAQIFSCALDGSGLTRITYDRAIDVEPTVNPKNPAEITFTRGVGGGVPQIYRMNIDGTGITRLSAGEGDAVNPSWHPDGQLIAFSWTKGYAPGNFNVFIMDVATREYTQLTHGSGRNENPTWAPDGRHLVFASNRSGSTQIWTMLSNGTQLRQLTTSGNNEKPVWSSQ